jgi:hypothetical protein
VRITAEAVVRLVTIVMPGQLRLVVQICLTWLTRKPELWDRGNCAAEQLATSEFDVA